MVLPMQRPASSGSAASAGDRRRPNRRRGKTFSPATSALPPKGGLTPVVFSVSRPRAAATLAGGLRALWVLLTILTLAGDKESNPGPQRKYTGPSCNKHITRSQGSICCNITQTHWTHIKCSGINIRQYTDTWKCNIYKAPNNTIQTKHQPNQKLSPTSCIIIARYPRLCTDIAKNSAMTIIAGDHR